MKFIPALIFATAVCMLAACTPPTQYAENKEGNPVQPPVQRERMAYLHKTSTAPITCTVGADCAQKWARAQSWVQSHSSYSIKTSTDSEIATSGPIEPTTDSAFTVHKTAGTAGDATIEFSSSCGKAMFCTPTTLELEASFHNYVMHGN